MVGVIAPVSDVGEEVWRMIGARLIETAEILNRKAARTDKAPVYLKI